jgi:hypothetical protein
MGKIKELHLSAEQIFILENGVQAKYPGKWIKLQDYISKDNLFYAANRALANVGNSCM